MEVFTLQEWEEKFDEFYTRVEEGETIGIVRRRRNISSVDAC